jgi:hypothetical protein
MLADAGRSEHPRCVALLGRFRVEGRAAWLLWPGRELREDPGDRFVALVSRHLPSLLHHRGPVAAGLVLLGLAKLLASAAMWEGQEWGGYLLAATVALLLPLDLRQAVVSPTPRHVLLATANVAVLIALLLLLRGWLPGRPLRTRATRTYR